MNNTKAMTLPQHKWLHPHFFLYSHRFNPALQCEIHSKTVCEPFSSEFLQFPHAKITLLCSIPTHNCPLEYAISMIRQQIIMTPPLAWHLWKMKQIMQRILKIK
jgi:hypothetical protein